MTPDRFHTTITHDEPVSWLRARIDLWRMISIYQAVPVENVPSPQPGALGRIALHVNHTPPCLGMQAALLLGWDGKP